MPGAFGLCERFTDAEPADAAEAPAGRAVYRLTMTVSRYSLGTTIVPSVAVL